MIVIAGRVKVHPEKRAEAVEHAGAMARKSRAEDGCHAYAYYSDIEDPNTFHIFEEWESVDALRAHFQTEHMAAFNAVLPDLLAGPFEIYRYDVTNKTTDFLAE